MPTLARLAFHLFLLAVFTAAAQAGDFLWRVRTNDSTVYLMGSIHQLREEDSSSPPLPFASFEQAHQESQQVVFEIDIDLADSPAISRYAAYLGIYPPGQTIESALSPTAYQMLRNFAVSIGRPPNFFDRMRPWFASSAISYFQGRRLGFRSEYGIDQRYFDLAKQDGKTRLYLETPRQQLNIIASTSQAEWAAGIAPQILYGGRSLRRLVAEWKAGNVESLTEGLRISARREPNITRALLVKRNLRWLPKIEGYLQQPGTTTLVVVGAAHLLRGSGLVALLSSRGYEVVQMPEVVAVSQD